MRPTLPFTRVLALAALLASLAFASALTAAPATAANTRVELEFEDDDGEDGELIRDIFEDDGSIAVFHVDLENEGNAAARNFQVDIYQDAAFPASMVQVVVTSGPGGIACVKLSSLKTRCTVERLGPGQEANLRVELVTGDARGLPRHGTLLIAATGLPKSDKEYNNHDSFDYTVVETLF